MAHRQYDFCYRDFRLSDSQAQLLEENIAACQRQGIQTALLLMPEGSEFRDLYSPEMSSAINGMLAQLSKRYNVQVVDARTWMPDDLFSDMHHLIPEGARAFAERLGREVIGPLLRAREAKVSRSEP